MTNKKNKTNKKVFGFLIAIILILALGAYIISNLKSKEKISISSETVESSLKEAKELTTLKYNYKNVASFENSQEFHGITLPFTTKKFLYTYQGEINAGVDLDKAKVDVNEASKIISVTLPQASILSHDIDENSVMVYDEKNSIFNPLKLEDYSDFRKEEEAKVEKDAIDKGLLEEAKEKSEKAVKEILEINPIISKEYTINIKFE